MTRDELTTEARHHADAESDGRWGTGRVASALDVVARLEWRNILNANRFYRTATRTPTVTAGAFNLSDLTQGTGDTQEVFYRIIGIHTGDVVYKEVSPVDVLTAGSGESAATVWGHQTWYRNGSQVHIIPNPTSTVNVLVNHMPPLPSALSAGSVTVEFPSGYEQILALETAALMLTKGGTETEAAAALRAMAEQYRRAMLSDVARVSTMPLQVGYSDSREEWGG